MGNSSDLINNYTSLDSIFRNIDQKEKEIFVLQIDEFDEWFKKFKSPGGFYRMPNDTGCEEEEQLAVPRDKIHEFLDLSGNLRFVNRCIIILTSNYREKSNQPIHKFLRTVCVLLVNLNLMH